MSNPPDGYRHHVEITTRFADMDAMGHVNNAKYLTYFETGRLTYFDDVFQPENFREIGVILAKVTVEFKLPLVAGQVIDVYTRASRMGNRSFDQQGVIMLRADDGPVLAATCHQVMVAFDYTRQQSMPLPPEWKARMIAYEPALSDE
jgi:acyl-CoA thioester hydrolase